MLQLEYHDDARSDGGSAGSLGGGDEASEPSEYDGPDDFAEWPGGPAARDDRFDEYVNAMEELVVACAHLDSKKDEEGAAKRRLQAMAAASEATRFRAFSCTNPSTVPILFVGDFNATPDEPAVRWLKQSAQPRFFSAYERADGSEPRFTTWKIRSGPFKPGEAKMCIDYVMASEGCEVMDVRKLAGEEEIGVKGLPCATHPSDHLLLRATIRLGTPPRREESQPENAT